MSEHDRNILHRWKQLQQTTRPFVHPIRKLLKTGGADSVISQDQLFKQQSEQIMQHQITIAEQQKVIQEQQVHIKQLQEQVKALRCECQAASNKLPEAVLTMRSAAVATTNQPVILPKIEHPPSSQAVPSCSLVANTPVPPSYYMPLKVTEPQLCAANMLPYNTDQVFSHATMPVHNQVPPTVPRQQLQTTESSLIKGTNTVLSNHPKLLPTSCDYTFSPTPIAPLSHVSTKHPLIHPGTSRYPSAEGLRTSTSPMVGCSVSYSPMHGNNFPSVIANESQNIPLYSPCASNPCEPFDDLDSLLNVAGLPTGSGAGYGVGITEEDLPASHSSMDLR